jgi:hypothetical protein
VNREGDLRRRKAHLYDLLVRHPRQENILLVVVRVKPNYVRDLSVAKAAEALTGLCIPEFHLPVISARQELAAIVGESKVLNGLHVSMESP